MANNKKPLTVRIDADILDRLRDIAYWHNNFSLNQIIEEALKSIVDSFSHIEKRPDKKLKAGRKIS